VRFFGCKHVHASMREIIQAAGVIEVEVVSTMCRTSDAA
jgi:hypothetical protein